MDIKKFLINLLTLLSTPIYLLLVFAVGIFYLAYLVGDKIVDWVRRMARNDEVRLYKSIQYVI